MLDSVFPDLAAIKRFCFFRILSFALWLLDLFSFLFFPAYLFLLCVFAHIWVVSRVFCGSVAFLLALKESSARIRADDRDI